MSKEEKGRCQQPLKAEMEKCKTRIASAREMMLDGQLDAKENREIREEYEGKIRTLEARISDLTLADSHLKEQLAFCGELLPNLEKYYATADLRAKKEFIGSIYPEKLIFEGKTLRTGRVNEVILLMCRTGKGSGDPENAEGPDFSGPSGYVARPGLSPATGVSRV